LNLEIGFGSVGLAKHGLGLRVRTLITKLVNLLICLEKIKII